MTISNEAVEAAWLAYVRNDDEAGDVTPETVNDWIVGRVQGLKDSAPAMSAETMREAALGIIQDELTVARECSASVAILALNHVARKLKALSPNQESEVMHHPGDELRSRSVSAEEPHNTLPRPCKAGAAMSAETMLEVAANVADKCAEQNKAAAIKLRKRQHLETDTWNSNELDDTAAEAEAIAITIRALPLTAPKEG